MRLLRLSLAIGSLGALTIAVACGIEDGGVVDVTEAGVADNFVPTDTLQRPDTTPLPDVIQPDTEPPPSCADAGACLPEFDGTWTPYLHIVGSGGCPLTDGSVQADYLDLKQLKFDPSACVCGNCAMDAGCTDPAVTVGTNAKCNNVYDGGVTPQDASCADLGASPEAGLVSISVSTQTAYASCSVSQTGNQGWDAAVASVCSSACGFDFCSAPQGAYERCALTKGVHACPNGYKQYLLDRPNTPAACTACTCDGGASCGGTLTMFSSSDCTDASTSQTIANQGCVDAGNVSVRSAIFDASISTTCKASASTPSLAPTNGELTLCCK